MYTIRQILGTTIGLTMSGVKHDANKPAAATQESPEAISARQKLQELKDFKGDRTDHIILANLLKSVHSAIDDLAQKNQVESTKIESELATAIANESNPETKKILEDIQNKRKMELEKAAQAKEVEKSKMNNKVQDATQATASAVAEKKSNERKLKDMDYTIERDGDSIKKESMVAMLADFDGMSGVELSNRGILRQALFGGGKQKEVVGEAQVYELLSRMDKSKLDALYKNLTQDSSGLPWKAKGYRQEKGLYDLDFDAQRKIARFQRELVDQASMMADISEALLGSGARMGLVAVLEGRTGELKAAISNSDNIIKFKKTIAESKVLDRDPNFLVKVASFLIKLGIQVPLAIASSGMVGGYAEATDIVITKGKDGKLDATRKGSLTVGEGSKTGTELSATADILGARLDAKWNSPTARITGLTDVMIQSNDFSKDARTLVQSTLDSVKTTEVKGKNQERRDAVEDISKSYLSRVDSVNTDPILNSEQKKEIIANMTMAYLSRVESIKGVQLEGVFAAFNTAGWMIGLSGGRVDTAATFSGVREGSARVEAEALARETNNTELQRLLKEAGVTEKDGVYTLPDGKTITVGSGQSIAWTITEEVHDDRVVVTAEPKLVSIQKGTAAVPGTPGGTFTVRRENHTLERIGTIPTDKEMADRLLILRNSKGKAMEDISTAITTNDYTKAKELATKLLEKSKNSVDKKLLAALNDSNQDLKSFFDRWLEKTSGGSQSRALADKINAGKPQDISDYYKKNKLNEVFGKQYGLSSAEVDTIIASYGNLNKDQVSILGNTLKNGFHALVAYAQINGQKTSFKKLDVVTNADAQIIGGLKPQTGNIETQLKAKLTESLKPADYRKGLPEIFKDSKIVSDDELKALIIDGTLPKAMSHAKYTVTQKPQVSTYLSYSADAECFNLGTVISSPTVKAPDTPPIDAIPDTSPKNTFGTGAILGTRSIQHLGFGLGVGHRLDKNDNKTDSQESSSGSGDTGSGNGNPGAEEV